MIEMWLFRHGETPYNRYGRFSGQNDQILTLKGKEQVLAGRQRLDMTHFDTVFISPLDRTKQTAHLLNVKGDLCPEIMESNFGFAEGLTYEQAQAQHPEEMKAWHKDWIGYRPEGGESTVDHSVRIKSFLKQHILSREDGKILLVTHEGTIRIILSQLLFDSLEGFWRFKVNNGSFYKLNIDEKGFAYIEN